MNKCRDASNAAENQMIDSLYLVCKIPLLARRTRPKGQARRATIGYLVYKSVPRVYSCLCQAQ